MNATPQHDGSRRISTRAFTIASFAIILLIACVVSFGASSHPDGLEFVAESTGFIGAAEDSATATSPFADYGAVFIGNPWLSLALAGAIGCLVTFGLAWIIGAAARRRAVAESSPR
ncbi:PDGLE domain-containing protein [Microbacterium sp. zg-Y818]|uniref:PDGLE domain-containing protein n=1 Tax=unclassified Microbacterium TaxID=2609290 RepID=UPI00214C2D3D|nr:MULTISPECIES: PDGLE domain-containing protein [unclassified Microbacterium]MCR2801146.1 PDGLE domain-containing protein [Microbacterium sp. zg.Y818]WIM23846.1 PDGLE domain-containing protein [Microbacterium sp. zg-Y818]